MFSTIPFYQQHAITQTIPLTKGWSKDQKYILENKQGEKFLLRLSDPSSYDQKQQQWQALKQIETLHLNCPLPLAFGRLGNGQVYLILSYLSGVEGIQAIHDLSDQEAYQMGREAGQILEAIHHLAIPQTYPSWWQSYQVKIVKKIEALQQCPYSLPDQESFIQYYKEHCDLMQKRPLALTHGDFHLGNMVIDHGQLGIIDFNKLGIADPYDDFKPFCWNVMESPAFESGMIDGYFHDHVPNDFFKILKFYTCESLISQLPWAVRFGSQEIETALKVAAHQMDWYDHMKRDIPTWYHSQKI